MCDGAFHRGDRSVALATSSSEHDGQIDVVRPMTLSDTKGARYDEPELARVQVRLAAGAAAQQQSVIAVHFQSHGTASASSSSSSFHTASLLTPSHTDSPPSRISVHSSGSGGRLVKGTVAVCGVYSHSSQLMFAYLADHRRWLHRRSTRSTTLFIRHHRNHRSMSRKWWRKACPKLKYWPSGWIRLA